MDLQRWNFLLAGALAATVATPTFGQGLAPTVEPPYSGEDGETAIPDFSGIWVHALPGFEPLAKGPTALVNRARRQNGTGDILKLVGDYTSRTRPF